MSKQGFCFIIAGMNEVFLQECFLHVQQLLIPDGYKVKVVAMRDSHIAKGYQRVMQENDEKYKIYLRETIFIQNKRFLFNVLEQFEKHPQVGLLGVAGSKRIPTTTAWWQTKHTYGMLYNQERVTCSCQAVKGDYEPVKALFPYLLVTQYDLPWQVDFQEHYFAALAQCLTFTEVGYEVGVVQQTEPWCICNEDFMLMDDQWQKGSLVFLDRYAKDLFPLVSILMPTYNRPDLFELALESALNQTYRNIEIIISDDGTDERTNVLMQGLPAR